MPFPRKNPAIMRDFLLKQLQLLSGSVHIYCLFAIEKLYISKLLVRNAHNSNISMLRQEGFNSFYMYLCILTTCTMTNIYRELEHGKSIPLQIFFKVRIRLFILLCFGRLIKQH